MTPEQSDHLKDCNCMVKYGDGNWLPSIRKDDGIYTTPQGLKVQVPSEWRPASHLDIVAEMDANGDVPIWGFGLT